MVWVLVAAPTGLGSYIGTAASAHAEAWTFVAQATGISRG